MAKSRMIAFWLCPAAWGLKGDSYSVAEAQYYYEGEELDHKLAEIEFRNNPKGLSRQLIELDYRHGHLDTYTYDHKIAELEITDPDQLLLRKIDIEVAHDKLTAYEAARQKVTLKHRPGVECDVALLEVEFAHNKISKFEFEKQRASLKDEPWVAIVNSGFDPEQGIDGVFFEFDWNPKWVEFLKLNGYIGQTPEQVVDDWFTDVCRSHSAADFAGSLAPSRHLHRD